MALLPARRSGHHRYHTVVNPSREFEDVYDRTDQLATVAFGLTPADVADLPWSALADLSTCPATSKPTA
jgi:hypothetical protein